MGVQGRPGMTPGAQEVGGSGSASAHAIGTQDRKRRALEALEEHLAEERKRESNVTPFRKKASDES